MGENRYLVTQTVQQVMNGTSGPSVKQLFTRYLRSLGLQVDESLDGAKVQVIAEQVGEGTIAYERPEEASDSAKPPIREFGALETKYLGIGGGVHSVPRWVVIYRDLGLPDGNWGPWKMFVHCDSPQQAEEVAKAMTMLEATIT